MEDLTQSGHTGVRWQAQMEAHLEAVRDLHNKVEDALKHGGNREAAAVWAHLAIANATAAGALATANGLSDLESAIGGVSTSINNMESNR